MSVNRIVDAILRKRTEAWCSFAVRADRVLDDRSSRQDVRFVADASYFEIRLSQMHLRDQREYWNGYLPLGALVAEFPFAGKPRSVPMVLGPERLTGGQSTGERVDYYNMRVVGPSPYLGVEVKLFAGLFRLQTTNWARRALSVLEAVTATFDPTRLSSFVHMSGAVVDQVEKLLGMDEVELRLAFERGYSAPSSDCRWSGEPPITVMHPRFEVLVRTSARHLGDADRSQFWVRDGTLFHGAAPGQLLPFQDADFMLLRVDSLERREDYATLDFHRDHWDKVADYVWQGCNRAAKDELVLLGASLARSPDVTDSHREVLLALYKARFNRELERRRSMSRGYGDLGFQSDAGPEPLGEAELNEALVAAALPHGLRSPRRPRGGGVSA